MEVFGKLIDWFMQQTNSAVVTILMLAIALLCVIVWYTHKEYKETLKAKEDAAKEEAKKLMDQIDKLQHLLYDKHGEEKKAILDILDKYHQSQITMTQALTGVQQVLTTLAFTSGRNGGH